MIELSAARQKRLLLVGVALVFVGWMMWATRDALLPFLIGVVIVYLLAPIVDRVQRNLPQKGRVAGAARPLAILMTYLWSAGALALVSLFLVPPVIQETGDFIDRFPQYWERAQTRSTDLMNYYEQVVPPTVQERVERNLGAIGSQAAGAARAAMQVTVGAVGTIIGFTVGLFLLPLWMFYVLKDQREGLSWFYNIWPEAWRSDVRQIMGMVDDVLSAYIRGQLILGVIIGVVTGFAMWGIGVGQALVLGLIAGVLELIPVLGPWIAFVVAALVTIATAPDRILLVALAFFGIQQLENTFLVPKIQGDAVRLHPAVVMLLLVIGGSLWGILGMIIIVPVAAVARDVFVYLYHRTEQE